jgi:hypothetical protein
MMNVLETVTAMLEKDGTWWRAAEFFINKNMKIYIGITSV